MKRTVVVTLIVLALLLLPAPVAPDGMLAADAAAQEQEPPASPEVEQELEEYVPSQKVSADASISFPTDI